MAVLLAGLAGWLLSGLVRPWAPGPVGPSQPLGPVLAPEPGALAFGELQGALGCEGDGAGSARASPGMAGRKICDSD